MAEIFTSDALVKKINARASAVIGPTANPAMCLRVGDGETSKLVSIKWHPFYLECDAEPGDTHADLYMLAWAGVRLMVPFGSKIAWRIIPAIMTWHDFNYDKVNTRLHLRFSHIHPQEIEAMKARALAQRDDLVSRDILRATGGKHDA